MLNYLSLHSLESRRIISQLFFLFKSLRGLIDSQSFIENIDFRVPRLMSRDRRLFHLERSITNMGLKAPIQQLMRHYNHYCLDCDIFCDTFYHFKIFVKSKVPLIAIHQNQMH